MLPSSQIKALLLALVVALACSAWALFGGGLGRRLAWDRLPSTPVDDAVTHAELIAAAAEAQAGTGSLFEAPRMAAGPFARYPVFQFYSFLPYHLPALAVRAGASPYHALLVSLFLSFVLGSLGLYGLSRALSLGLWAALLGSAAFCLAPFHLSDLFGRFAYPELIAFGLLPWLFWSAYAAAKRPSWGPVLASSALWAAVILSHNIFHVWTVPLLALWLLALKWREPSLSLLRPLGAYALGLGLSLFFFAPVLLIGSQLSMAGVPVYQDLNPALVLFNPLWIQTPFVARSAPFLGLQIGWCFLLPALLLLRPGRFAPSRASWLLFALVLFLAWSPFDFWPCLGPWQLIQFPYRFLVYGSLFGSLLLAQWCQPWLKARHFCVGLLILGLWCLPWKRSVPAQDERSMASEFSDHGLNFRTGLLYVASDGCLRQHPQEDLAAPRNLTPSQLIIVLPRPWYPGLYQVRSGEEDLANGFVGLRLAVQVPANSPAPEARFVGLLWAQGASLLFVMLWLGLALQAWKSRGRH